jgi:hypothetical protein
MNIRNYVTPTVGRIVHYTPSVGDSDVSLAHQDQPLAAIIVYVHTDEYVNLVVFDADGRHHRRAGVLLLPYQAPPLPEGDYCRWPDTTA